MTNDLTTDFQSSRSASRGMTFRWLARHDLTVFFILAFVLSWYPWVIGMVRGKVSGPNPLGPFIAALVVTGLAEGRSGIRSLLGRIVRARIRWSSYALVFGFPILLCAVALLVMGALGQPV